MWTDRVKSCHQLPPPPPPPLQPFKVSFCAACLMDGVDILRILTCFIQPASWWFDTTFLWTVLVMPRMDVAGGFPMFFCIPSVSLTFRSFASCQRESLVLYISDAVVQSGNPPNVSHIKRSNAASKSSMD